MDEKNLWLDLPGSDYPLDKHQPEFIERDFPDGCLSQARL